MWAGKSDIDGYYRAYLYSNLNTVPATGGVSILPSPQLLLLPPSPTAKLSVLDLRCFLFPVQRGIPS